MAESTLPRELQLIIEDIVEQNVHLLEWEVFGNTTEDMRVVLTWRRIDGKAGDIQKSKWLNAKQFGNNNDGDDADDYVEDYWEKDSHNNDSPIDEKERQRKMKELAEEAERQRKKRELEEQQYSKGRKQDEKKKKEEEERKRKLEEEEKRKKEKALRDAEEAKKKKEEAERKQKEEAERKKKEEAERKKKEEAERKQKEEDERKKKEVELQKKKKEEEERKKKEEAERKRKEEEERKRKEKEDEERRRKQELEDQEKERKRKEVEEEKLRMKKREQEEQEYNRRKNELADKENQEKLKQLEQEEKRRKLVLLEDEQKERKKREFEEQEYNRRKQELEDAENRRKANDLDDKENRRSEEEARKREEEDRKRKARELEDEKNQKRQSLHDNDADDFVDLNARKSHSKEHAMRMLQMQRNKLSESIDNAGMDDNEMKRRFPDGPPGDNPLRNGLGLGNGETDLSVAYGAGSGFNLSFDTDTLQTGYGVEYDGAHYKSSKIKRYSLKQPTAFVSKTRVGAPVIRVISQTFDTKGWQGCVDCQYNDFCDRPKHKDEYMHMLFEDAKNRLDHPINQSLLEGCDCNVCTGGAVHNGCFYRELLRLKSEYLVFDKYNYCFCCECIPFKYRRICLRREMALLRAEDQDHYYRLTNHDGDDGIIRHQLQWSDDSNYGSDDEDENYEEGKFQAVLLDDIPLKITKDDKISFRDCPDCQCNGFCDNIRHKKIYQMLLHIDDEDFEELDDDCWCLVCEFKGAAHSGCAEREIRRLKYDCLLFDVRNLCYCHECVPFKYRKVCLRQEMKKRRNGRRTENLYALL